MLFASYGFLAFLAVLFCVYYVVPIKFRWSVLLAASYFFYCMSGIENLAYILVTTITVYFAAIFIERGMVEQKKYLSEHKKGMTKEDKKAYKEKQRRKHICLLAATLLLNIGILAAVKYGNFFIANFNTVLKIAGSGKRLSFVDVVLPMGISFYTLQAIGYLIDIYRETVSAEKNIFKLALFISFFPQVVQGPISRFEDLSETLYSGHSFNARNFCHGLQRVLWGYFKKLVIADRVMIAVNTIIQNSDNYRGVFCLIGMLFYTIELYADFTGGIDITIGVAEALGIRIRENFIRPYFSKSLKEYWRRWHISMCSWFRDYVFYPVSSSRLMRKLYKYAGSHMGDKLGRRIPVYVSSFIVWAATGIWHGASWNFVVWGIANWFILMVSEELEPVYTRFHKCFPNLKKRKAYLLFETGRTFALVCCLNLFDCYDNIADTFRMLGSALTVHNWHIIWDGSLAGLGLSVYDYAVLFVGVALMVIVSLVQRGAGVRERISQMPYAVRFALWYGLFLAVLIMGEYGIGYDASQFIYNRF